MCLRNTCYKILEQNSLHKYQFFFADNLVYEKNIIFKRMAIFRIEIWIENYKYSWMKRSKIEALNFVTY